MSLLTSAPCLTKSVWSASMGVNRSKASLLAVPAQDIPTAMHAPQRTCRVMGGREKGRRRDGGGVSDGEKDRVKGGEGVSDKQKDREKGGEGVSERSTG